MEFQFTFYRPLLDADGRPSSNLFVLQQYAEHAPDEAHFILKAPQAYTARTMRSASGGKASYQPNETYLDAAGYVDRFLGPAADLLGTRLAGVLFEQEYARVGEAPEGAACWS